MTDTFNINFYINGFGKYKEVNTWAKKEFYRIEKRRGQADEDVNYITGYYEIEIGLPKFQINEGTEKISVDPKVRDIRPFVVGAIVRNIDLDEDQVGTLMNIQEALHWALGRDRMKVAIGIHDYDQVKGPYIYSTVKGKHFLSKVSNG